MTSLQTYDNCQNTALSFAIESSRLPLDSSMRIIFTGYFNGFSIEVRSVDEMALLHHMGCFGKGSASRSKPRAAHDCSPVIMRKRQFLKRNYWHQKFANFQGNSVDKLLTDIDELVSKIIHDSQRKTNKDVIDLVSSDESNSEVNNDVYNAVAPECLDLLQSQDKQNLVVIVPDSDSEEGDYLANLKPKCCVNKIKVPEKLMLTLQEAFFLSYGLGCLQVVDNGDNMLSIEQCWTLFTNIDSKFLVKYVVYHYFRAKGYIVKSGIKFGGDYVLYQEGPGVMHADYIVVIKYPEKKFNWISVLGHVRMATTTVKEVLIAEVVEPSEHPSKMPEGLSEYSVREILLTRNIPVTINEDIE